MWTTPDREYISDAGEAGNKTSSCLSFPVLASRRFVVLLRVGEEMELPDIEDTLAAGPIFLNNVDLPSLEALDQEFESHDSRCLFRCLLRLFFDTAEGEALAASRVPTSFEIAAAEMAESPENAWRKL